MNGGSISSMSCSPTESASAAHSAQRSWASIHFEVEDVDRIVATLKESGLEFESGPVDQPYLWREATLLDPDGNRIFIYHAGEMRLNPPWRVEADRR
jgi:uncharacterized glyoxalase superfamily protein PhnB